MQRERYGKFPTTVCSICGRENQATEMHHIISRKQINSASAIDLHHLAPGLIRSGLTYEEVDNADIDSLRIMIINHLPQNIIELCGGCHDLTEASDKWLKSQRRKEKRKTLSKLSKRERTFIRRQNRWRRKGHFQCQGQTKMNRRCEIGVPKEGGYCRTHKYQDER